MYMTARCIAVLGSLLFGLWCGSYPCQAEELQKQQGSVGLVAGGEGRVVFELVKAETRGPSESEKPEPPEQHPPTKEFENKIGMKFVLIPAGTFVMGSPVNEAERNEDERQHEVTITKPFYLQTTELTQGQWKKVMKCIPFSFFYFKECGDDCPVENGSWRWAQDFVRELNKMEGTNKYRLPTEAEWEYACRAGSTTTYHFGSSDDALGDYAWYFENSLSNTHPVGQKKPNAWGLYDMHGNVAEWCQDWYGDYPAGSATEAEGPSGGAYPAPRGRAWVDMAKQLRSASRGRYVPGARLNVIGFRVARDL
jgi:formylglycine-generating enzyme required for sulfatase activity